MASDILCHHNQSPVERREPKLLFKKAPAGCGMVHMPIIPELERQGQENKQFKITTCMKTLKESWGWGLHEGLGLVPALPGARWYMTVILALVK